jgi:putative FmdB family regulatory protein
MPLYEYKCHKCGKQFEVMQKFSDAPLTTHEGCGGDVDRLLSAPALQFKGSGWYITDYAKAKSSTPAAKTGDSGSGDSAAKTEGKPDTKTGSKSDSSSSSSSTTSSSDSK